MEFFGDFRDRGIDKRFFFETFAPMSAVISKIRHHGAEIAARGGERRVEVLFPCERRRILTAAGSGGGGECARGRESNEGDNGTHAGSFRRGGENHNRKTATAGRLP